MNETPTTIHMTCFEYADWRMNFLKTKPKEWNEWLKNEQETRKEVLEQGIFGTYEGKTIHIVKKKNDSH